MPGMLRNDVTVVWRGPQVIAQLNDVMDYRMKTAMRRLHQKTYQAISISVVWDLYGNVIERSKPGEYPRMETQKLRKTLFWEVDHPKEGITDGIMGTPLDYGLFLETRKQKGKRHYLTKSLWEQLDNIKQTLLAPI